ncbi:MAG TPA: hypothetical protein VL549_07730 [Gemmatimonadales bacterium]|nr:hypothetical protein [Gemmatimonadales bacterium]
MHSRHALSVISLSLLFAACNSTEPNLQHISLSTQVAGASRAAGSASGGIVADQIITATGGSVRITAAQLVLSHVKLASDTAGCATDSSDDAAPVQASVMDDSTGHEHADSSEHPDSAEHEHDQDNEDECEPLHVGAVTVNLPLDGSTQVALDALVPAGTYTAVMAKLDSVTVTGVFTDSGGTDHPFTFAARVRAHIAMEFSAPITVSSGTNNLTINVDIGAWFKDQAGAIIDPTNAENAFKIREAIRASFHAFQDDNHDGADDHDEGH